MKVPSKISRHFLWMIFLPFAIHVCPAQSNPIDSMALAATASAEGSQAACASVRALEQSINSNPALGSKLLTGPATVTLGTSAQYTNAEAGSSRSLVWSVNLVPGGNAKTGTIDQNGIYSAPNNMPRCSTMVITAFDRAHVRTWKTEEITLQTTPGTAPAPTVVSALPMGTVKQNANVMGRDGTWSVKIKGKSYWLFNDTPMYNANAEGANFISNSLAWTDNLDASNGIDLNHDLLDSSGLPTEFMPFTKDEIQFNQVHNTASGCTTATDALCGESYAIWPGPVVAVPNSPTGEAYDFYVLLVRGGSIVGWNVLGIGIAKEENGRWIRPVLTPGTDHPTLMWHDTSNWSGGGLVQSGYVYMSGCGQSNAFGYPECEMARVPLPDILNLKAWTYYNGNTGQWSTDSTQATMLFYGGPSGNTIFFNPALNEYMTVYADPYGNNVVARVAPTPWGPYSDEIALFTGEPPIGSSGNFDYAAQPHPEFQQQNGLVQYVTYVQDNSNLGWLGQDIQLVKVTFAP